jgi:flagellar motor switch protein FliM
VSHDSLSQSQIDALLGRGASAGATAAPARSARSDTQLYDFRRPHRISTDKMRSLRALYESLGKSLEGWLLSRVRGDVQITLQGVEQYSFGEFTLSLPTPCASFTFEVKNTGGQGGVVDFGSEFAFFLVDRLFGGGTELTFPNRALTPLERMSVRSIADRALTMLAEAWQEYVELEMTLAGFESVPDMLRIANREDPVLVATYDVSVAQQKSLLIYSLPFAVLERFFAGGTERRSSILGSAEEQAANQVLAERALRGTRVRVAARLPQFRLSLRELLSLQTGSLVATGIPRNADLDVLIGQQRRFQAAPGRLGTALAVRLTDDVRPAPETVTIPFTRS